MYIKYCIIAVVTIFAFSLVAFYLLKKKNLVSKRSVAELLLSTSLATVTALLTPPIAKLFAGVLDISPTEAIIITVVLFIYLIIVAFRIIHPFIQRLPGKKIAESTQEVPAEVKLPIIEAAVTIEDTATEEEPAYSDAELTLEPINIEEINLYQEDVSDEIIAPVELQGSEEDIQNLLDEANSHKITKNYEEAIKAYEAALILNPNPDLAFLIILDLCSLYKIMNKIDLALNLLESNSCRALDSEKKADILRNIKTL